MYIECTYYDDDTYGYICKAQKQRVLPENCDTWIVEFIKFIGKHEEGRTDNDVTFVEFEECIIHKVPQGLTKKFQNLKGMEIWNSGLKDISRSDLLEYKSFTWLFFGLNNIEYLPGDLFADCKNLEGILFCGNPLDIVEPNILDGLANLKSLNMSGKTVNYGKIESESTITLNNPTLLEIKEKLYEEYNKTAILKLKGDYVKKMSKDNKELNKLKSFFQTDEALKDFHINIGEKQFLVHKAFLAAQSPTMAEILRNNPQAEYLNLVDISVNIFEAILEFLYTDELPDEIDFIQLFAAAERLKIENLKEYAAQKIIEQLDHENAPEVLNLGSKYRHDGMKRNAFEKIKRKYPEIELKKEWLDKDEHIEKIVEHLQKIRKIEKNLVDSLTCED